MQPRAPGRVAQPGTGPLLQEMYAARAPVLLGGMAATMLLMAYPPVMVPFAAEWRDRGYPPDPCRRLIPRWLTAVTGSAEEAERLRRRAAAAHSRVHGPMPAEVDQARFGTTYSAADPVPMTAMYVVVLYLMLAAQELLHRRLAGDAERDRYCVLAAASAGFAFGVQDRVPVTISGLREGYERILAEDLQATELGRDLLQALLAADIGGVPGAELAGCAALLLDRRAAVLLGPLPAAPGRGRAAALAGQLHAAHGPGR